MVRYVVTNLDANTSKADQDKLAAALKKLPGVRDVTFDLPRKEVVFGISSGPEPKLKLLKETVAGAGFTLGDRK